MSALASPPSRFLGEEELRAALDEQLRRSCPAVVMPAGSRRSAADLPAARLYVVEEGVVVVRAPAVEGRREMIVLRCVAGSVLPRLRSGETMQSLTDAWLTAVPDEAWRRLVASPAAAERLLDGLEEALVRQREASRSLAGIRHVDRVRDQLLELAREHGRVCRDGIRIALPLTHDLLADMVGCARETVTRAVDELASEGFVVRRGRSYALNVEPAQLSA